MYNSFPSFWLKKKTFQIIYQFLQFLYFTNIEVISFFYQLKIKVKRNVLEFKKLEKFTIGEKRKEKYLW